MRSTYSSRILLFEVWLLLFGMKQTAHCCCTTGYTLHVQQNMFTTYIADGSRCSVRHAPIMQSAKDALELPRILQQHPILTVISIIGASFMSKELCLPGMFAATSLLSLLLKIILPDESPIMVAKGRMARRTVTCFLQIEDTMSSFGEVLPTPKASTVRWLQPPLQP
jgi:hypothetical protein